MTRRRPDVGGIKMTASIPPPASYGTPETEMLSRDIPENAAHAEGEPLQNVEDQW